MVSQAELKHREMLVHWAHRELGGGEWGGNLRSKNTKTCNWRIIDGEFAAIATGHEGEGRRGEEEARDMDDQVNPGVCQGNYTTKTRNGGKSGWENSMCGILKSALIINTTYAGTVIDL